MSPPSPLHPALLLALRSIPWLSQLFLLRYTGCPASRLQTTVPLAQQL